MTPLSHIHLVKLYQSFKAKLNCLLFHKGHSTPLPLQPCAESEPFPCPVACPLHICIFAVELMVSVCLIFSASPSAWHNVGLSGCLLSGVPSGSSPGLMTVMTEVISAVVWIYLAQTPLKKKILHHPEICLSTFRFCGKLFHLRHSFVRTWVPVLAPSPTGCMSLSVF